MYRKLILFFLCLAVSACTWVRLTNDAEKVVVKTESEVSECKRVAKTTVSLRSKVLGIERNDEKIKLELETLARNAAVEYGGNAVAPITEIEDGSQSFGVYKC